MVRPQRKGPPMGPPRQRDTPIKAGKAWKTRKNRKILPKSDPRLEPLAEEPGRQVLLTQTGTNMPGKQKVRFRSPLVSVRFISPTASPGTTSNTKSMEVLEKREQPLEGALPVAAVSPDIIQDPIGYPSSNNGDEDSEDSSSSVADEDSGSSDGGDSSSSAADEDSGSSDDGDSISSAADEDSGSSDDGDSSSSVAGDDWSSPVPTAASRDPALSCDGLNSDGLASSDDLPSPEILLNEEQGGPGTRRPARLTTGPVNSTLLNWSQAENISMQRPPNVSAILGSSISPAENDNRLIEDIREQHEACSGLFQADKSLKIVLPKLKSKPIKIRYKKLVPAVSRRPAPEPGQTRPEPGQTHPEPGQTGPEPGQTHPELGETGPTHPKSAPNLPGPAPNLPGPAANLPGPALNLPGPAPNLPTPKLAKKHLHPEPATKYAQPAVPAEKRPKPAQTAVPPGPRVFDMSQERVDEFIRRQTERMAVRRIPPAFLMKGLY